MGELTTAIPMTSLTVLLTSVFVLRLLTFCITISAIGFSFLSSNMASLDALCYTVESEYSAGLRAEIIHLAPCTDAGSQCALIWSAVIATSNTWEGKV